MLYSANKLLIILIPLIMVQYIIALFCLVKLVLLQLPKKEFILWNLFILLIFYIGFTAFLICYYGYKSKAFKNAYIEPPKKEDELEPDLPDKNNEIDN